MNGGGPTAQIVERDGWKTDKDFVGHRKAITCVSFNSNMLRKASLSSSSSQKERGTSYCCCAIGSRDRSLSIWLTSLKRPLVVIHELFLNSVCFVEIFWKEVYLKLCRNMCIPLRCWICLGAAPATSCWPAPGMDPWPVSSFRIRSSAKSSASKRKKISSSECMVANPSPQVLITRKDRTRSSSRIPTGSSLGNSSNSRRLFRCRTLLYLQLPPSWRLMKGSRAIPGLPDPAVKC